METVIERVGAYAMDVREDGEEIPGAFGEVLRERLAVQKPREAVPSGAWFEPTRSWEREVSGGVGRG
jgi:hypothetical protein